MSALAASTTVVHGEGSMDTNETSQMEKISSSPSVICYIERES